MKKNRLLLNTTTWMNLTDTVLSQITIRKLRIRLPMQETQVRTLVREDPACRGATKPTCHNY